jgi:hypothetical protein
MIVSNISRVRATMLEAQVLVRLKTSAVCLAALACCGLAQAATVQQLGGEVRVVRASPAGEAAPKTLRNGERLAEGDALLTSAGAEVFVRMDDGGALAVRENSRVQFQELKLRYRGKDAVPEGLRGQTLKLTVGALRYVTGVVGKARPQSIRFATPTATIGIRGTDLDLVVREVADVDILPGTYVQVNAGGVVLEALAARATAPAAEASAPAAESAGLNLGANEAGFVGEPVLARGFGGRASASIRKLQPPAEVFKRSKLDQLFR